MRTITLQVNFRNSKLFEAERIHRDQHQTRKLKQIIALFLSASRYW